MNTEFAIVSSLARSPGAWVGVEGKGAVPFNLLVFFITLPPSPFSVLCKTTEFHLKIPASTLTCFFSICEEVMGMVYLFQGWKRVTSPQAPPPFQDKVPLYLG